MRLLALTNIYPPGFVGGYELAAAELLAGLAGRGHAVHVLTSDHFTDDANEPRPERSVDRVLECVTPARLPSEIDERAVTGNFVSPRNLRALAGALGRLRPDVVLGFNLAGLGAPALLQMLAASGVATVLVLGDHVLHPATTHAAARRGFARVFTERGFSAQTRSLLVSRGLQREIEADLGRPCPGASIVPNWFHAGAEAGPLPLRAPDAPARFVFASQIVAHKGVDAVLGACRELLEAGRDRFTVDMFGRGDVALLLQRVAGLRLGARVRYRGSPEKAALMPLLRDYDALLCPTWHREPFGMVVAEAAAAGCVPIVSAGAGAAEWFVHGRDALKIEPDAASLAAAMRVVLDADGDTRARMARHARDTARRFFRFADVLDRVEAQLVPHQGPAGDPRRAEAALLILHEIWKRAPHADGS